MARTKEDLPIRIASRAAPSPAYVPTAAATVVAGAAAPAATAAQQWGLVEVKAK